MSHSLGSAGISAQMESTHNWMQLLESGRVVGTQIDKLKSIDLKPVLLRWIQSYLAGRRQQLVVNDETSELLPVNSGVPRSKHSPYIIYVPLLMKDI